MKRNMKKKHFTSEGEYELQKLRLAHLVYIEISTRIIYTSRTSINFAEFLNICFPLIEGLREAMRSATSSRLMLDPLFLQTGSVIADVLSLQDKWNFGYTNWLSNFKSRNPNAKKIFEDPKRHVYEDIQSFFTKSDEMSSDIVTLIVVLNQLEANASAVITRYNDLTLGEPKNIFQRIFK